MTTRESMRAMVLKEFGGTENLVMENIPLPDVKSGEVLIEMKAIGINPIDIKSRKGEGMAGYLKKEHPMVLGWDVAGVISETGAQVKKNQGW